MKKTKSNNRTNSFPEPYEDFIRLENLDPYESLIKSNVVRKQNNDSMK